MNVSSTRLPPYALSPTIRIFQEPKLYGCFEDDGAVYLVMEYIDGVTMNDRTLEQRKVVETELERYMETLRGLRSDAWGGPGS
ncbi:hypothetical protein G6O67_007420 [Ophiocordyceps sinensis]|uniref:Protein kinase-like domain protein n=2 Tax=Ophiocordyceps sinensis TaxID=72228 RepID=A0A8H4LU98_9HYPO|nr:Protein kinase-like domain protein [Ophiocordyceps sinensis CO18]KAF4505475.1 hypothetical protein G6O67_007420 [Ophiocordyceps sinensis]